jgi:predicted transposase YdaD
MDQPYDRGSKWMLEHHPEAVLRLAVGDVVSWRAGMSDLVAPRQLPDALYEVQVKGRKEPVYVVVEASTYPERRSVEQARTDAMMVLLSKGVLPEVVVFVLCPRGTYRTESSEQFSSPLGTTRLEINWRVINLWEVAAERLLELGDVGAIPWVPLAQTTEEPAALLKRCRERIDQQAPPDELANFLAVTWMLGSLRYNEQQLRTLFGGRNAVVETPFIQWLKADPDFIRDAPALKALLEDEQFVRQSPAGQALEARAALAGARQAIKRVLAARFQALPADVEAKLDAVTDAKALDGLTDLAATCAELDAFRARLP